MLRYSSMHETMPFFDYSLIGGREFYQEPKVRNDCGAYAVNETTMKNFLGDYLYYDQNYALDYPVGIRNSNEEYLDAVLRNAKEIRRAKVRNVGPFGAPPKTYLRRKKLKSFMVRDLIDLPDEENKPDMPDAYNPPCYESDRIAENYSYQSDISWDKNETLTSEPTKSHYKAGENNSMETADTPLQPLLNFLTNSFEPSSYPCDSSDQQVPPSAASPSSESQSSSLSGDAVNSSSKSPDGKAKRIRTIFNSSQLDRLEMEFERSQYMVGKERSLLATELNLSESQVKVWFQNRRIKYRKQFQEQQHALLTKLKESESKDSKINKDSNVENSFSSAGSEGSSSS